MDEIKLTKPQKAMLERITQHQPILELSLVASGGRAYDNLNALKRAGLVKRVPHPTVIDRAWGGPVHLVRILV